MKKKVVFVSAVVLLGTLMILLIPCVFKTFQKENVISIQYNEMNEMIEKKESFFLLISKEGCPDCNKLKNKLNGISTSGHILYIYEYDKNRTETLISELQDFFPNFIVVPYICYVNKGIPEEYSGEMDTNSIFKWIEYMQNIE